MSRNQGTAIIVALVLAEFTSAFELTMIYASIKTFFALFGDPLTVGWLITGYLLVSAAAAAICGKLGDRYGRKSVLLVVLTMALTGSAVSMLSSSLLMIVVGRAIQGMAGAILPLCFAIARESLPERRIAYGVSAIGSTAVLASGMGILLGGIIIEHFGWRGIFCASTALALLSFLAVAFAVPRSVPRHDGKPLDVLGGVLFVPAIFALLLVVGNGRQWGWAAPSSLTLLVLGVTLGALWIRHELRIPHPLINLRLLSNRKLLLANLSMGLYGLGPLQAQLHILVLQQPRWTGIGVGLSPTLAGLYSMPGQVTSFLMAPIAGWVCIRLGSRNALLLSAATITIGWATVLFFPTSLPLIVLAGPVMAVGTILIYCAIPNIVVAAAPSANTAECAGITQVFRSSAQAAGAQIVAAILASATVTGPQITGSLPAPSAIITALFFVTAVSLAMLAVALFLPRRIAEPAAAPTEQTAPA